MLTAEQIKAVQDIKVEKVHVPEWAPPDTDPKEAFVFVRGLAGVERDEYEQSLMELKKKGAKLNMANMRAKLVAKACVHEDGVTRLFDDAAVVWLGKKSAAPLDRIYGVAQKLCGATDEDMEELLKNLEATPADASS